MLARIHIMKGEQGMSEDAYRDLLRINYGVESAKALSDAELGNLIGFMGGTTRGRHQVEALKEKAAQIALHSELTPERFRGLVKKICGVEDLRWCGDAVRLKRLLAALGTITNEN